MCPIFKFIETIYRNNSSSTFKVLAALFFVIASSIFIAQGQDLKYNPKGKGDEWNFNFTPFLLVPNISGDVQSKKFSEEFSIGPSDFIETMNGAFMIDAEISKGKYFASPAYIFTDNEVKKIFWTSNDGSQTITAYPALRKEIVELIVGKRLIINDKLIVDPFGGFRYTNYKLSGKVEGIKNTTEIDEQEDFWDPIIGIQLHYYPEPRIPIELKTDIGGFSVGSKLTWSVFLHSGYAVSPAMDILIGVAALENQYENETGSGNIYGLNSLTYGFDFGLRFYLPARFKDPAVFKNAKKI